MPIERKEITLTNGDVTIEEIYMASSPQPFAIINNGMVINTIVVDADEYTLEEIQNLLGGGNLVKPLPESYGIGDFYDADTNKWAKAPQPQTSDESKGVTNDRATDGTNGRQT